MADHKPGKRGKFLPLGVSTGDVGTLADLNERVLKSVAIPANTLNRNNKRIKFKAWGGSAADADGKTVRARLGPVTLVGTIIFTKTAGFNNRSWELEGEIVRTGVGGQSTVARLVASGTVAAELTETNRGTPAVDETVQQLLEITGQNAVAHASDIFCSGLIVDVVEAP